MIAFNRSKHFTSKVWTSLIRRHIFKNSVKPASSQAIPDDTKYAFHQKLEQKIKENDSTAKPEGWELAKPFEDIPGMKPLPIIGNNWKFMPGGEFYNVDFVEILRRLEKRFGRITHLSGIAGRNDMVFLYDPEDFETLMRNEGPWPIRDNILSLKYYREKVREDIYQGKIGLASAQGEDWFKMRTLTNKVLMQPRTFEMYVGSIDEVADDLLKHIRKLAGENPKREMPEKFQAELYKWTLESVGVIAYNKRIGCLNSNLSKDSEGQKFINTVLEMFDLIFKLDFLPSTWKYISTRNWRKFVRAMDYATELNQKYVNECLASIDPNSQIPDHERSVLERLVRADKRIAITMATDMLIAGVDTTGKAMASTMYFLAKNPHIQEKLRDELKRVMPNKNSPVNLDNLKQMDYLRAVIKEAFRLAPAATANQRRTVKDMVLAGYRIPKGVDVVTVNILAGLNENNFLKPNEFIPERWLRSNTNELSHKNVHPFVFLPFGFGPRSCIGKRLANLELEVGLAKVIRNFKLSWNHPDAVFASGLLYGIVSPLKITVDEIEG